MFYGSNVWDPGLIIAQIISVQCLFYVSLGLIQALMLGPVLGHITVGYIFDWATLHFTTRLGWLNWLAHVSNALAAAGVLAWIVERAKKCLDFGATCYIWHAIFVCWYSGWPRSFAWWSANVSGLLTTVLLGEWLCVRREMQDIPLSIPQRLGSNLLSRAKGSGAVGIPMMPLATEDPDMPARPRLRTGLGSTSTTTQRAAAAAAATAASSTSFSGTSATAAAAAAAAAGVGGVSPVPGARPGSAVQMAAVTPPRPEGAAQQQQQQQLAGGAGGAAAGGGGPGGGSGSGSTGGGGASRKKLLVMRPPSSSNLLGAGGGPRQLVPAVGRGPAGSGGGAGPPAAGPAAAAAAAAAAGAAVLPGEVEPV